MPFSETQLNELNAPLSRQNVRERKQGGRDVSYIEAWHALSECNRIFGFDAWSSETIETHCVVERDRLIGKQASPGWTATYNAKVRITVYVGGDTIIREGCGTGHGIDQDLGQAHESALKEAESDARKRALMTFGSKFGLALYDKSQQNVADEPDSRQLYIEQCKAKIEELGSDPEALKLWWNGQHDARVDFDITPAQLLDLKSLVSAKLPKRTST